MRQKDIVDLDREKTSLDTVIDRRVAEWNVLLLLKKDNEDGVLPKKRGGPGNTDLLHLMIGTAWRTHVEVTSKSIPIVPLKNAAEGPHRSHRSPRPDRVGGIDHLVKNASHRHRNRP